MKDAKLCLLTLFLVMMIAYFKQENPKIAFVLKISGSVFLALTVMKRFEEFYLSYGEVFCFFRDYASYIRIFVKAMGICYLCEFVSNIAKEEGMQNFSTQVEMLGKLSVFSLGIPVLATIFQYLQRFLN